MKRLLLILFFSAGTLAQAMPFPFMPLGRLDQPTPVEGVIALSGDLDFRLVSTGMVARRQMRIAEVGGVAALQVDGIDYPEGFIGAWTGVVNAGGHADVTVEFSPVRQGSPQGTIVVRSDAAAGTGSIMCSGVGTPLRVDEDYRALYTLQDDELFRDLDGDGYTTFEEWLAGTNPRDGSSFFSFIMPVETEHAGFVVSWPGVAGRSYRLLRSTNLTANAESGFWEVAGSPIVGEYPVTTHVDEEDAGEVRIYRVEILVE